MSLVHQVFFLFGLASTIATCTGSNSTNNITNASVSIGYSYPYQPGSYSFMYTPADLANRNDSCTMVADSRLAFAGSAQYFVFMSVVTFLYGIIIVIVYVFFYTKKLNIYKYAAVVVSDHCHLYMVYVCIYM